MLERVEIKGFKCLHDVSVDLRPFNVLIGPNDSGKSSFLQALAEPSRWLRGLERMSQFKKPCSVLLSTAKTSLRIELDRSGAPTLIARAWDAIGAPPSPSEGRKLLLFPESPLDEQVTHVWEAIPPEERRSFRASDPLMLDPVEIASPSPRGSGALDVMVASRGRGVAAHLARLALRDRPRFEAIQDAMRSATEGRVLEVIVDEDLGHGYPLWFRLHDGTVITASELSHGLLLYLGFLAVVYRDDGPGVLLIDEPEKGLHPLRLFEVVELLRTLTKQGIQVVMTTHSPDLLNAFEQDEVIIFRRPKPDSSTEVHRLPKDFKRRSMGTTMGEVWASSGEEGLLDMLPKFEPQIRAEAR